MDPKMVPITPGCIIAPLEEARAVSGFRKTLYEETERLDALCTQWSDTLANDEDPGMTDAIKVIILFPVLLQYTESRYPWFLWNSKTFNGVKFHKNRSLSPEI